MRLLLKRITKHDPTTFTGAFAMWAMFVGLSLVIPGNAFELTPAWSSLQLVYATDHVWGWTMILDGMLLLLALRLKRIPHRAAITLFSSIMWWLLGISMLVNAWTKGGFISVLGCYSVWCGIQGVIAVEQWVNHPMPEDE